MTAFLLGAIAGFVVAALGGMALHAHRRDGHAWCAVCGRVLGVGQ